MSTLKIVLVDDHPIVRAGFKQLLELEPGWQVIAEVGSAQELAAWMLQATCDVLVLDLSLPDGDGLVMLRHLLAQRPELAIVVLTMHDGALYVQDAIAAGARGYVTKSSAPDELVDAIRVIGRGETYLGSDVRGHDRDASSEDDHDQLPELTAREAQVFLLLARGHHRHQRQDRVRAPHQHLRQAQAGVGPRVAVTGQSPRFGDERLTALVRGA